jgi:hypothetical protein
VAREGLQVSGELFLAGKSSPLLHETLAAKEARRWIDTVEENS